jgi:signal transduction histidine kinase
MRWRRLAAAALRAARPRWTVRLRLTLWYGGLFLLSGAALLIVSYGLVVRAITAGASATAACRSPGVQCHVTSAQQARAIALQAHATLLTELWSRSAIALGVMTVLSIASGWFIAGRALRPVRAITAGAKQISAASLGERLALTGPDDELKELGDTFDRLLARLEASFRAQRQFIANAAHEMRTPLARQQVISQVALADPAASVESLRTAHERVLAAGSEQQHIIDALLTLARGQAGLDSREPFDLATVIGQVLLSRQAEASDRGLVLRQALAQAPAAGSPALTERMAANLIDNSLRHNVPGGRVEISTRTTGRRAVLSIVNTGPVVPAAALERLFQPFQRMAAERIGHSEGLGLGLSIVHAIAQAHGARITADPLPEGGLVVEVSFPDPQAGATRNG